MSDETHAQDEAVCWPPLRDKGLLSWNRWRIVGGLALLVVAFTPVLAYELVRLRVRGWRRRW